MEPDSQLTAPIGDPAALFGFPRDILAYELGIVWTMTPWRIPR